MTTTFLIEERSDVCGDYTCFWHCPGPEKGTTYRVTKQYWDADYLDRHIYEIEEIEDAIAR